MIYTHSRRNTQFAYASEIVLCQTISRILIKWGRRDIVHVPALRFKVVFDRVSDPFIVRPDYLSVQTGQKGTLTCRPIWVSPVPHFPSRPTGIRDSIRLLCTAYLIMNTSTKTHFIPVVVLQINSDEFGPYCRAILHAPLDYGWLSKLSSISIFAHERQYHLWSSRRMPRVTFWRQREP